MVCFIVIIVIIVFLAVFNCLMLSCNRKYNNTLTITLLCWKGQISSEHLQAELGHQKNQTFLIFESFQTHYQPLFEPTFELPPLSHFLEGS